MLPTKYGALSQLVFLGLITVVSVLLLAVVANQPFAVCGFGLSSFCCAKRFKSSTMLLVLDSGIDARPLDVAVKA